MPVFKWTSTHEDQTLLQIANISLYKHQHHFQSRAKIAQACSWQRELWSKWNFTCNWISNSIFSMWQHLNFFQTFQVKHQNPWRCFTRQLKTNRFFIPTCSNKQSMIQCLKVDLKYLMQLERAPQKKYFCQILEWNLKWKWSEVTLKNNQP